MDPAIATPLLDAADGTSKKRDRKELNRQQKVMPAIGGYFTVLPMEEWAEWFTNSVVLNRVEEEGE